ncbi:MAG: YabP/YqfC family sporulation protein [Clostridia bacterium]|nr:YabP/YqfC family sporulation protein [Clostridia bacterium]
MEQLIKEHSVHLEKGTLTVTGVTNVDSFDSKTVIAALVNDSITVKGENLTVLDLDIKGQTLVLKGTVASFVYGKKQEKVSLVKRIFK